MKHYLFEHLESGEEFIVGTNSLAEARQIAKDNFGSDIKYWYQMSEYEAEASGLDEY